LTFFQKISGFREKGVALYQALIELNLNSSSESLKNSSLEDQLTFFEQFWDCSASRIGDQVFSLDCYFIQQLI
jgi:hypothetical protein